MNKYDSHQRIAGFVSEIFTKTIHERRNMSVNKAILIGRLGQDPEMQATPAGRSVTKFTLATSEKYKDKDGNKQASGSPAQNPLISWPMIHESSSSRYLLNRSTETKGISKK